MRDEADALELLKLAVDGKRQKDAARSLGISPQYLNDLLQGRRGFSVRLLAKLGLRRAVVRKVAR